MPTSLEVLLRDNPTKTAQEILAIHNNELLLLEAQDQEKQKEAELQVASILEQKYYKICHLGYKPLTVYLRVDSAEAISGKVYIWGHSISVSWDKLDGFFITEDKNKNKEWRLITSGATLVDSNENQFNQILETLKSFL